MYYGKRTLILTCVAAILAGTVLHFGYHWLPNAGVALFSPVKESIWEHTKLIFWPYLSAALLLNRGRPGGIRPWLLVLPIISTGMLLLGYGYHILLGGEAVAVDIGIYIAMMALGFWLPTRFSGPFSGGKWTLPLVLTVGLGLLVVLFTVEPPEGLLFADLSQASAWLRLC